ncbi:MAG: PKD domain-containing protein, partial [Bacteroidota bacterium]
MKKILFLFLVLFLSMKTGKAQQLTSYEYWFDNNYVAVVSVPLISTLTTLSLNEQISTAGLTRGFHFFHIRFKDSNGNFSSVQTQIFNNTTLNNGITTLINYEYWFDNDYAGKTVVGISNNSNYDLQGLMNAGTLTNGIHAFHLRFQDDGGNWSNVLSQSFMKFGNENVILNEVIAYRYWFNSSNTIYNVSLITLQNPYELTSQIQTRNYTHPGSNDLHIQFQDTLGNWSSVLTATFNRDSIPVADFASNSPVCVNSEVSFTNTSSEADSYYWQFGDGNFSTDFNPTHTYSNSGNYTVTLTSYNVTSG